MRYLISATLAVAIFALAGVAGAATSGYHFTNGGAPVCTDIGIQLQCTAEIAGLGGGDVIATISAPGATETGVTCTSPGGNQAPGQNPAIATNATGSATYPNPKNGRLSISPTTDPPVQPTPQQAGCPNGNWRASYTDVVFFGYTLTISQAGQPLFTCTGSFGSSGSSSTNRTSTPTC
jgi:hypothetical protein